MPGPRHADRLADDEPRRRPRASARALAPAALPGVALAALASIASLAPAAEAAELSRAGSDLLDLIRQRLAHNPTLQLAGQFALMVSAVGVLAGLSRGIGRFRARRAFTSAAVAAEVNAPHAAAWIEAPDGGGAPVTVGELLRIGDGDDCELALETAPAIGTCAIIQRTADCEYILLDVSAGGARLAVNGAPSSRCRLIDGDRIEIGAARMVFRTGERVPEAAAEAAWA
jgi:hypothetical protein